MFLWFFMKVGQRVQVLKYSKIFTKNIKRANVVQKTKVRIGKKYLTQAYLGNI